MKQLQYFQEDWILRHSCPYRSLSHHNNSTFTGVCKLNSLVSSLEAYGLPGLYSNFVALVFTRLRLRFLAATSFALARNRFSSNPIPSHRVSLYFLFYFFSFPPPTSTPTRTFSPSRSHFRPQCSVFSLQP